MTGQKRLPPVRRVTQEFQRLLVGQHDASAECIPRHCTLVIEILNQTEMHHFFQYLSDMFSTQCYFDNVENLTQHLWTFPTFLNTDWGFTGWKPHSKSKACVNTAKAYGCTIKKQNTPREPGHSHLPHTLSSKRMFILWLVFNYNHYLTSYKSNLTCSFWAAQSSSCLKRVIELFASHD